MNAQPNIERNADGGTGYLVVRVTTARGAIPLEGAQVDVRDYAPPEEAERGNLIVSTVTGRDGNTERIALAAPPRTQSLQPSTSPPYAIYTVEVHEEGYYSQSYIGVPIFDGITAVQPADMIPLPENIRTDSRTPDDERFFEAVPNESRLTE